MASHTKRLRIFAGPNGSGKSTLAKILKKLKDSRIKLGVFVNADEIQTQLEKEGSVSLNQFFRFKCTTKELRAYLSQNGLTSKLDVENPETYFKIIKNRIYSQLDLNSYVAAMIAAFVRNKLIEKGKDFSFETVFSHDSKIEIIKRAKREGYRIYFYFITTESPEINVNRVKIRVAKNGHPVDPVKIESRYFRSLDLLYDAVKLSNRAFLFDNSGKHYELVAQIIEGKKVEITDYDKNIPRWFVKYIYDKAVKN